MANNIESLLEAYAAQVQDLETAFLELLEDTRLENAVGVQLDRIGVIVGLERGSLSDDDYRARLSVRIETNKASGTISEILSIAVGIIATEQEIAITEYFPAAMVMRIADELVVGIDVLVDEVSSARAAGVNMQVEYTLEDDDDTFTFATGDAVEASPTQGFSNDAGTTGGVLAFAVES